MFNVFSEFQPLKYIAVGNINSNVDLLQNLSVLGQSHKKDLELLFDQTRQDFNIIKQALTYQGVTIEECKTYNVAQDPAQSLPLAVRLVFSLRRRCNYSTSTFCLASIKKSQFGSCV